MKIKLFLAAIFLVTISGCTRKSKPDFLYLNANQLKPLGIELNNKGLFYKNENTAWNETRERYACLAFYCTNDHYLTTRRFDMTDTLKRRNSADSLLVRMKMTRNDFYPLLIGGINKYIGVNNENESADMKLLPVAICMAETHLPKRKDTVILWLRPTESLKVLLPKGIHMEDYVRSRVEASSTSGFFNEDTSGFLFGILCCALFNYYRNYILALRRKRVSEETFKNKRRKIIILIFLVTWGVISALQISHNNIIFLNLKWLKPLLIGFGEAIIFVSIPVFVAEFTFMKIQNKKEIH